MKTIFSSTFYRWCIILFCCLFAVLKSFSATNLNDITSLSSDTLHNNFPGFWNDFRLAVMENDTNKIIELTLFPFKTRGPMDSDPVVMYTKREFFKVFKGYLNQKQYLLNDSISITNLNEIERTKFPDERYITSNWARVGNLEFIKKNEKWTLNLAYLEYPTINVLTK
jgi:hypothetical protein